MEVAECMTLAGPPLWNRSTLGVVSYFEGKKINCKSLKIEHGGKYFEVK
jgi:hypothetical protein